MADFARSRKQEKKALPLCLSDGSTRKHPVTWPDENGALHRRQPSRRPARGQPYCAAGAAPAGTCSRPNATPFASGPSADKIAMMIATVPATTASAKA